jgi:hypothetical protein
MRLEGKARAAIFLAMAMAQFDEHDKTELELYVENTGELYEHRRR